jgi:hypothetical protein
VIEQSWIGMIDIEIVSDRERLYVDLDHDDC